MVSSTVVSVRFAISPSSRRVYTIALALTVGVAAVGVGCRAPGAQSRMSVDVDGQMIRGTAAAPVTIVEFSDYQ